MYIKIGNLEIPEQNLSMVVPVAGEVSFSGELLEGDSEDFLTELQQMKSTTQHLYWEDNQGHSRRDIVHVEEVSVEERIAPDQKGIKRYNCRTKLV